MRADPRWWPGCRSRGDGRQRSGPEEHARRRSDGGAGDQGAERGPLQQAQGDHRGQDGAGPPEDQDHREEQGQEGQQVAGLIEQGTAEGELRVSRRGAQAHSHRLVRPQHRPAIPRAGAARS